VPEGTPNSKIEFSFATFPTHNSSDGNGSSIREDTRSPNARTLSPSRR